MSPARIAGASCAALGGWGLLWYAAIHPTVTMPPLVGAAALALPILLCARPAWRGGKLALGVAGFLGIGYLAHALTELVANPPERSAAAVAAVLALMVLVATSHALRAQARSARRADAPPA